MFSHNSLSVSTLFKSKSLTGMDSDLICFPLDVMLEPGIDGSQNDACTSLVFCSKVNERSGIMVRVDETLGRVELESRYLQDPVSIHCMEHNVAQPKVNGVGTCESEHPCGWKVVR